MYQMRLALRRRSTICQKKCCINNALDGSENDIVWEDDVEDNNSVMSDDDESDE
jgi:hypothetical protein